MSKYNPEKNHDNPAIEKVVADQEIDGYLSGLNVKERLILSNAYASLYISNQKSEPATMNELLHFLDRWNSF